MVIKRVGPMSCAKIGGTAYAILGLIVGAIISLVALAGGFRSEMEGAGAFGAAIGVGAIVAVPIFYGAIGALGGLIGAWIYNVVAGMVGGVELDVQ